MNTVRRGSVLFDTSGCRCVKGRRRPSVHLETNCCAAIFAKPGYPETDRCNKCGGPAVAVGCCPYCGVAFPVVSFCETCGPGAPGYIEVAHGDVLTPPDRVPCPVCG